MNFSPHKLTELVFTPRARVIWLALTGFFLGSALCPLNPPPMEESSSKEQGETMNSAPEIHTNIDKNHLKYPVSATRETEKATFALG